MTELRSESKYGEVTLFGDVVSVKLTPDRRVWYKWEGKQGRFSDTGRKCGQGLNRQQKEIYLVQYRNMLLERFAERGYGQKDVNALAAQQRDAERRREEEPEKPIAGDDDDDDDIHGDDEEDEEEEGSPPPPPPRPN